MLDSSEQAVSKIESEFARLGQLEEDLHASTESLQKLNSENTRLRNNADELDKPKRMARLRDNSATIDLEQGDARRIERNITAVKSRIVALGRVTKSASAEILHALSVARRITAKKAIENLLDVSQLGAVGGNLELSAHSVLALKDLQYYFAHHVSEPDYEIVLLRQLRQNFEVLRDMCANEERLVLTATEQASVAELQHAFDAPLNAMAEPVGAGNGNQLGSSNVAVVAT